VGVAGCVDAGGASHICARSGRSRRARRSAGFGVGREGEAFGVWGGNGGGGPPVVVLGVGCALPRAIQGAAAGSVGFGGAWNAGAALWEACRCSGRGWRRRGCEGDGGEDADEAQGGG